jgi:hypothetical protein
VANNTVPANLTITKVDNSTKKVESLTKKPEPKGVINPPIPAKNATVQEANKQEDPVKLQVTEDVHSEKKHSHKHKKHHHSKKSHHKSHKSHRSQKESTELQILNDRDALFNDEM